MLEPTQEMTFTLPPQLRHSEKKGGILTGRCQTSLRKFGIEDSCEINISKGRIIMRKYI